MQHIVEWEWPSFLPFTSMHEITAHTRIKSTSRKEASRPAPGQVACPLLCCLLCCCCIERAAHLARPGPQNQLGALLTFEFWLAQDQNDHKSRSDMTKFELKVYIRRTRKGTRNWRNWCPHITPIGTPKWRGEIKGIECSSHILITVTLSRRYPLLAVGEQKKENTEKDASSPRLIVNARSACLL